MIRLVRVMLASSTLRTPIVLVRLTRLGRLFDTTQVMSTIITDATGTSHIILDVDKHDTIMDSPQPSDLKKLLALMVIGALAMQATAICAILGTILNGPLSGSGARIPTYTVEQRLMQRARLRARKKPRPE